MGRYGVRVELVDGRVVEEVVVAVRKSEAEVQLCRRDDVAYVLGSRSLGPSSAAHVEVLTSEFQFAHGRMPAGRGNWAFFLGARPGLVEPFWYNGLYSEAKRAALAEAVRRGVYRVYVGS